MTKMKTKRFYEAPLVEHTVVELEGGFCGSVVQDDPKSNVKTTGHEINEVDFATQDWNDGSWE